MPLEHYALDRELIAALAEPRGGAAALATLPALASAAIANSPPAC